MSPLIATVLLIAFAVALGAMIMNWGAGTVVDDGSGDISSYCEGVKLVSDGPICYSDNQLSFKVKNIGSSRIEGIKIKSVSDIGDLDMGIKDSSMIIGESIDRVQPFIYAGGSIEIEFVPIVLHEKDSIECSGFVQSSLPSC